MWRPDRWGLAALLAVATLVGVSCGDSSVAPDPTVPTTVEEPVVDGSTTTTIDLDDIPGVEHLVITSRDHTTDDVDYPTVPPAGGDHLGVWHNCGIYTVPLHDGAAVHTMEHGTVWVTYEPGIGPTAILELTEALAHHEKLLVSPYEGQPAPVIATAWGRRLEMDDIDDPRLAAFIEAFTDGDYSPEPGVRCTGAIGVPPDQPFVAPDGSTPDEFEDRMQQVGIGGDGIAPVGGGDA